jgi:hypothetical protein
LILSLINDSVSSPNETLDKHAVDFSQINILDYDNNKSYFEALGVPEGQIFNVSFGEDTE